MASDVLWIGLVEVRARAKNNFVLDGAKGAFVDIVTWASDQEEYRLKVNVIVKKLDLFAVEITNAEPVSGRRKRTPLDDDTEEMVERATNNPNAIIYGTFDTYDRDDA
jgi:hypothetical protein